MDDLRTILKDLTEKNYSNIQTYFNDKEELVIYCESNAGVFTLTCIITGMYDTSTFLDGGFTGTDSETFSHNIDGHEVRKQIMKLP